MSYAAAAGYTFVGTWVLLVSPIVWQISPVAGVAFALGSVVAFAAAYAGYVEGRDGDGSGDRSPVRSQG